MNDKDKQELIQELRNTRIIDDYGNIDFIQLIEDYGQCEANNIIKEITFKDIYKTVDTKQLYNIAEAVLQDLQVGLMKHRFYTEDASELLDIITVINEREELG